MPKYLLIILATLSSCASSPKKLGPPQTTEIVNIRLIPNDINRIDKIIQHGLWGDSSFPVETGPVWKHVFVGNELSDVSFKILKAYVDVEFGYSATYTYKIEGQVLCNGKPYPITAQGSRSAAWALENAMRQSVERGIVNAAQKAKFIVENCKKI